VGKKKGGNKRKVENYYYGVYYGACVGPVTKINGIRISDKDVPNSAAYSNLSTQLNQPTLFGGDDQEGGINLSYEVYLGGPTQQLGGQLASKHGGSPSTVPGYRGLCSVYLTGWWGYDNSYVRPVEVDVTTRDSLHPMLRDDIEQSATRVF